jgi:hypothetical protein
MRKHLKRKKICESVLSSLSQEECLNILETGEVLTLEFLKKQLTEKDKQLTEKDDQIKKLQKLLINKDSISQTGDHNTANNNCNYIHIHVNSYEKTDYTVLKDKIHTCIKNGKVDEAKLIKLLHFNKDAPQNHNIKIENKRENRIKFFNGTEFEESEYNGKEGIFKFSQDTLNKTGDQEYIEEGDKTFNAIENTKDENMNLDRNEKAQKIGKVTTVIYNGNKLKKKSQLTL